MLELARVARSTWKHWTTQQIVAEPEGGLHGEGAVVEAVVVALLVEALDLRRVKLAWNDARADVVQACLALPLDTRANLSAVVDLHAWELALARGADELHEAVHAPKPFPRGQVVIPLADVVQEARRGFWKRAQPAGDLAKDKRRSRRKGDSRDSASS
jgi:hypothetical protein